MMILGQNSRRAARHVLMFSLGWSALGLTIARGQEVARSSADPQVPIEELRLMLRPMLQTELEIEASAWIDLLRTKVAQISDRELEVRRKNREITEAKEAADEAEETAQDIEEAIQEATADAADPATAPTPPAAGDVAKARADAEKAAAEAAAQKHTEEKQQTLETLNQLREEQAALIDRTNLVLDAWEDKGGDAGDARKYVSAVSGIASTVDVSDVSAAWAAVRGWMFSKEGGLRWARNLLLFLLILVASWVLSRVAGSATQRAMSMAKARSGLLKEFMSKIIRRAVFFVGCVVSLSVLEIPVSPFLAAIGGAALVIGLALQGTLSNFASGIMILLHRPFDVGDVIDAAGVSGKVESMSVLSTIICTFDNKRMIVPNNSVWSGVITNVTGLPKRRVDMTFGIGYEDDISRAREVLEDIVRGHPLVLQDPEPVVRLHELADSSVNFVVRPWSKTGDYWEVFWDVTQAVKERFDAEGISIPFPQRDVHLYHATTQADAESTA